MQVRGNQSSMAEGISSLEAPTENRLKIKKRGILSSDRSLVFIGFKSVGKSTLARAVALELGCSFIDLDEAIEVVFEKQSQSKQSCREIMQKQSPSYFRHLENRVLTQVMQAPPTVMALGGGAPLDLANQALIHHQLIIHVTAPASLVFKRILGQGLPAFFSKQVSPEAAFQDLWQERERVYKKLAHFSIHNEGSIESGVEQVLQNLHNVDRIGFLQDEKRA